MSKSTFRAGLSFLSLSFGVGIIASAFFAVAADPAPPCTSPTSETVTVTIYHPDGTSLAVPNVPWIDGETVSLAMMNAHSINSQMSYTTSYFCPWGSFVTTIDGFAEGGDHYWALFVNGIFAQKGMDTYALKAGDKVEWKVQDSTSHTATETSSHQVKSARARVAKRLDALSKKPNS